MTPQEACDRLYFYEVKPLLRKGGLPKGMGRQLACRWADLMFATNEGKPEIILRDLYKTVQALIKEVKGGAINDRKN